MEVGVAPLSIPPSDPVLAAVPMDFALAVPMDP